MKIGYARVSTRKQNIRMQVDALKENGCEQIYEEYQSGAVPKRPKMEILLKVLRKGDQLVVWSLDRLSRTKKEGDAIIEHCKENGIEIQFIKEGINTNDMVGKLAINLLLCIAESERERSIERTLEGLEAAKKRGAVFGRKPKLSEKDIKTIVALHKSKEYSLRELAEMYGVTKVTIWRNIKKATLNK